MKARDQQYARVVEQFAPHSRLLRTWPLAGGISAGMTVLEIQHPGGLIQKLVVRRPGASILTANPRAAEIEFKLLQTLQALGLAAPTPLGLDTAGSIFSTPYLVTAYIDGQMNFSPADPHHYAIQMASHLVQIHSVDLARTNLAFLPRQPHDFAGIVGLLPPKRDPAFDVESIRAVLERARPECKPNPPTLLHGDYWPGNILWQGERLAAVVDWEDACTGDPLSDLAISRLDLLWIIGADAMHAFTHHYQSSIAQDYSNLPLWDLCAALRLIRLVGADLPGWAAYFHPYDRLDITAQSIRECWRTFVTQAIDALGKFG